MEEDLKKILGQKIRYLRKIQDITQMDLARALGMTSTGAISQVENGSKGLTLENIGKAAAFFGIHPCELLSPVQTSKEDLEMLIGVMRVIRDRSKHYEAIRTLLRNS